MKKVITTLFLIAFMATITYSQDSKSTSLAVYGNCTSKGEIEGYKVKIQLVLDKSKCDPETGTTTLEEQELHLREALEVKSIPFSKLKKSIVESTVEGTVYTTTYYFTGSEEEVKTITKITDNQEILVNRISTVAKPRLLEDQDESAICALENAIKRAKTIAASLGYEHCLLVGIDDDTRDTRSSFMFDDISLKDILNGASSYGILGYFELY
jgi:hypothetical protein